MGKKGRLLKFWGYTIAGHNQRHSTAEQSGTPCGVYMASSLISRFFRFGIFFSMLFGVVCAKQLWAQQQLIASNELCGGNADCASYRGAFDLLVHEDGGMAEPPGKRPENRSHILVE